MTLRLSDYAAALPGKNHGALLLLALLILEGPKTPEELTRALKCSRRSLSRYLHAVRDQVVQDPATGRISYRTNLSGWSTLNNNNDNDPHTAKVQTNQQGPEPELERSMPLHARGTPKSAAARALMRWQQQHRTALFHKDTAVRKQLYERLAERVVKQVPGATREEVALVIARVDRWFVRPKHRPYLGSMVRAAAESTAVAAAARRIWSSGIQYFSGTLENMARMGSWRPSRPAVPKTSAAIGRSHTASAAETVSQTHRTSADPLAALTRQVCQELGLGKPLPGHLRMVRRWKEEMGFSDDLILLAAEHAAVAGAPHLRYMDAVLTDWSVRAVSSVQDAARLLVHRQRKELQHTSAPRRAAASTSSCSTVTPERAAYLARFVNR